MNEFRLNHPHECIYESVPDKKLPNGEVEELKDFLLLSGHSGRVTRLLIRKGLLVSGYFLSRSVDGTVRMWRLSQQNGINRHVIILPHILPNQSPIEVVAVDYNQYALIVSLASDGIPRLWSSEGVLINTIQHSSQILSVEWDPSGIHILAAHSAGLSVWDSQGILIRDYTSKLIQDVKAAAWRSSTEFTIQTATGVWIWRNNEEPVSIFGGASQYLKWSPDKNYLAIIQALQLAIYTDDYGLWWMDEEVTAFQFASKDFKIAVGNAAGEVQFWDMGRRSMVSRVLTSIGRVERIALRKDDEFFAACSEGEVQIWYMDNLSVMRKIKIQSRISDM